MTSAIKSTYTNEQITTWLRGLITIAWADGHFEPEERAFIGQLTQDELAPSLDLGDLEVITPGELAATLGKDKAIAENFLRTAVMIAVSDGVYSASEAELIRAFNNALDLEVQALDSLEHTLFNPDATPDEAAEASSEKASAESTHPSSDILHPVREWLDEMEIHDPQVARFICKAVPSQCPFERDIKLFGHKVVHIPPLCKLNPLYEQLVGLRFRALSYLADECKEDVSAYI